MVPLVQDGWSSHLDYQRLEPSGRFYLRRVLQDDAVPNKVKPGTVLDPILVVLRVAETIAVGLAFAKALGSPADAAQLAFAFRWKGLKGRKLEPWANPFAMGGGGTAHDDEVSNCVEAPLDTPVSAIGPIVDQATRRLFAAFDGQQMPLQTIEEWVRRGWLKERFDNRLNQASPSARASVRQYREGNRLSRLTGAALSGDHPSLDTLNAPARPHIAA